MIPTYRVYLYTDGRDDRRHVEKAYLKSDIPPAIREVLEAEDIYLDDPKASFPDGRKLLYVWYTKEAEK